MEKQQDSSAKNTDKKSNPLGNNLIWILLGVGVLTLVLVKVMSESPQAKIKYSDLVELIKQHERPIDESAVRQISRLELNALIEGQSIQPNSESGGESIELSNLADVDISQTRILATVQQRRLLSTEEGSPQEASQRVQVTWARGAMSAKLWKQEIQHLQDHLKNVKLPFVVVRGYHTIHDEGKNKNYRYSDLTDIEIGAFDVKGKVKRQDVATTDVDDTEPEQVKFFVNKGFTSEAEAQLDQLMLAHGIEFDKQEGPSAWRSYIPLLLMIGLFIVVFFFMMKRLGGAGSPMAFGRSRGKMYGQDDIGITFDDVAGIDEAREELREVVEFLRLPEKYQALGGRIPKGVLLVGPPGTGKTLLAKAIAGEAGVPFFGLSGSDFVEMFVGVGAARVRDMFQQATARAPSIIFIDELDALGKTRGSGVVGGHDEREQTLNALLVEMDGFESNNGVIVMAATNRPETLDPALLRPGRFDRQVLVDRPDVRGRQEILQVHVLNVKLDDTVDLKDIAGITSGFVGADLANLVNEAALLAARRSKVTVGMAEFDDAVERVTAGLEKKERYIHQDEKQRVAYHEAGHALVAYCLPNTDPVHKVSIIPRGLAALGYTMQRPEDDRYLMTQSELESRIQVLLAGTLTEEMIYEDISTGAQNDLERASEIARSMVMEFGMSRLGRVNYSKSNRSPFLGAGGEINGGPSHSEQTSREIDEEVKRIIDDSIEKVRDILLSRKASLVALTERLMEQEVVDASELDEVIEDTTPSPQIVPGTSDQTNKRTVSSDDDKPSSREQAEG